MAKMMGMSTAQFNELLKLSSNFVTQRQGIWDHSAWLEFVSNAQQKGFDLSGQMLTSLGEVLEAMKRFYSATASIKDVESAMFNIAKESAEFIQDHKGAWGHSEWEAFTRSVEMNTLNLSEETTNYLGNILESTRVFYSLAPITITSGKSAKRSAQTPKKMPATEARAKPAANTTNTIKEKAANTVPAAPAKKSASEQSKTSDDLTAITGVGPAIQKKLNSQGIRTYAQIAALTDKEIEQLEQTVIKFSGRIKRDDWMGQARQLDKS